MEKGAHTKFCPGPPMGVVWKFDRRGTPGRGCWLKRLSARVRREICTQ